MPTYGQVLWDLGTKAVILLVSEVN